MAVNDFLSFNNFVADPFESTNAENEPLLVDYFVPPPYFTTIMGDPERPTTNVILAPRGSGKTAQRRMIEDQSEDAGIMCVTYDVFDLHGSGDLEGVDLDYHLRRICRRILIGVLVELEEDPFLADGLETYEKDLIKALAVHLLGSISSSEFKEGIQSVKSLGEKASDVWKRYGGPISATITVLLRKAGIGEVELGNESAVENYRDEDARYQFDTLVGIVPKLGFSSLYVLIDRVDETTATSADAAATFQLIAPLLMDLQTLESDGVGFKFFLWDQIGESFYSAGGRPDRVPIHELSWSVDELRDLMRRRLAAYSEGRVGSLNQIACPDVTVDLDHLVAHFSEGSPRDSIRIGAALLAEATRVDPSAVCVSSRAVWDALRNFAEARAQELAPSYMPELRKIGKPDFTIAAVASEVFKISTQAMRSKVQKWGYSGAVIQVGEIPNQKSRPQHVYGVVDVRVLAAMLPAASIESVLRDFVLVCPNCGGKNLTSRDEFDCRLCGAECHLENSASILDAVP